jgi:CheY-like chemotaxis protein
MVVDDNSDLANTLGWIVEAFGDEVLVLNDGASALTAAAAFRPDVALLDIGMPLMDGLQLCAALKETLGLSSLVAVAQTGWGDAAMRARAKSAGFDHHFLKPMEVDTLAHVLDSVRDRLAAPAV